MAKPKSSSARRSAPVKKKAAAPVKKKAAPVTAKKKAAAPAKKKAAAPAKKKAVAPAKKKAAAPAKKASGKKAAPAKKQVLTLAKNVISVAKDAVELVKKAVAGKVATKPAAKTAKTAQASRAAKPPTAAKPGKAPAAKADAPMKSYGKRADLGAPIDGFFAKQAPALRPILEELRRLVEQEVPGTTSSLKWGMPFYMLGDDMVCALGAHKSHVNLILSGPPGTFADPDGLLAGDGKTGRHLKLTALDELPTEQVRGWLRAAADRARGK